MRLFCAALIFILCMFAPLKAQEQRSTFVVDDIPLGADVPLWVREAWIGLRMPYTAFGECSEYGAITHENVGPSIGYWVVQHEAIELLKAHNPRAAQWWIDQGFPRDTLHFCFSFPKSS